MKTHKEYEDLIVAQLQAEISEVHIAPFPDNPDEYNLLHPKGALLVRFAGSDFQESTVTGLVRQRVKLQYDVIAVSRNLRDHYGAYDLLDQAITALTGFNIDGEQCYPVREDFLLEKDGLWQYGQRWAFWALHQE